MEEALPLLSQRVTQLEAQVTVLSDKTVLKELHTAEYRNLERRIDALESLLKTIIFLTITNLLAGVGFLAWQAISAT